MFSEQGKQIPGNDLGRVDSPEKLSVEIIFLAEHFRMI